MERWNKVHREAEASVRGKHEEGVLSAPAAAPLTSQSMINMENDYTSTWIVEDSSRR